MYGCIMGNWACTQSFNLLVNCLHTCSRTDDTSVSHWCSSSVLLWTFCVNNEQDAQLLQRKRHAFGSEFRSASEFISRSGSGTGTRIWTPCRNQTNTRIPVHAWSLLCIISASCIDYQLWLGLRRLECSLPGGGKHCVNSVIPYYT